MREEVRSQPPNELQVGVISATLKSYNLHKYFTYLYLMFLYFIPIKLIRVAYFSLGVTVSPTWILLSKKKYQYLMFGPCS
jgi:hypothetical protein